MKNCLFEGVRLVKNTDPYKYVHSGYGIGFDSHSEFLIPDGSVIKFSLFLELIWAHLCILLIRENTF